MKTRGAFYTTGSPSIGIIGIPDQEYNPSQPTNIQIQLENLGFGKFTWWANQPWWLPHLFIPRHSQWKTVTPQRPFPLPSSPKARALAFNSRVSCKKRIKASKPPTVSMILVKSLANLRFSSKIFKGEGGKSDVFGSVSYLHFKVLMNSHLHLTHSCRSSNKTEQRWYVRTERETMLSVTSVNTISHGIEAGKLRIRPTVSTQILSNNHIIWHIQFRILYPGKVYQRWDITDPHAVISAYSIWISFIESSPKEAPILLEHVWQQTDGKTWHRGGIPCLQVEILHSTQDVVPILLSSGRISNAQHAHPQELVTIWDLWNKDKQR